MQHTEIQHKGIGTIKLRNRRKSEKDISQQPYTIGTLTSQSAAVVASMAAGKSMMPSHQDIDEDDDDAASLADDGLSSSSSSAEDLDSGDEVEALADSPEATPMSTSGHAQPGKSHSVETKRRSTDQSTSSESDPSVPGPLQHKNSGYFDRIRRESSPNDLTVPTPGSGIASGATTPGGSKRPFFLRGRSKASTTSLSDKQVSKKKQSKKQKRKNFAFDADHGKDILGIVVLEIQKAEDLPRIRSSKFSFVLGASDEVHLSEGPSVFAVTLITSVSCCDGGAKQDCATSTHTSIKTLARTRQADS